MPYVCAPGRSQVDGQRSALREKEEPRVVRAACNNSTLSSALCDLSPVCDYLSRNSWMKSDPVAVAMISATPSPPMPLSCQELFLENRVSIAMLFDSMRPASLLLGFLSNSVTFRKRARSTVRRKWILLLVNRARLTIVSRGNSHSRLFNDRLEELWQVS